VITRESNRRHMTVKINLRGRALASFLGEAAEEVANDARFEAFRKAIVWGGQFENQNRAQVRLAIILPISLGLIFILLYGPSPLRDTRRSFCRAFHWLCLGA